MNLWLVTNIRLRVGQRLPASSIQNLQTAMAMADAGHRVLLWVAALDSGGLAMIEATFGRALPGGLTLMACPPKGRTGDKKTPFSSPWDRLRNIARARAKAPAPEAVISRSPLLLRQLRGSRLVGRRTRLVLEYQYPEWAQLWRGWRKKHPKASLAECRNEHRRLRSTESLCLKAADGIMYAARSHQGLLDQAGCRSVSCRLPSGCPAPEAGPVGDSAPFDLGYVGSLAPENGLELLLASVAECEGVRLCLVGAGNRVYTDRLRALADRLHLTGRVEFCGAVAFGEIRARMRQCRVGVVPISGRCGPEKRQYASPLKLMEWMAAGVPTIASAVPSVAQQVDHGRQAWLVPPDDPAALTGAIRALAADPVLRRTLAEEGLKMAANLVYPCRVRRMMAFIEAIEPTAGRARPGS